MAESNIDFEPLSALQNLVANKINSNENCSFEKGNGITATEDEIETKLNAIETFDESIENHELDNGFTNNSMDADQMDAECFNPPSESDMIDHKNGHNQDQLSVSENAPLDELHLNDSLNEDNDSFSLQLRDDSELEDRGEESCNEDNPEPGITTEFLNSDLTLSSGAAVTKDDKEEDPLHPATSLYKSQPDNDMINGEKHNLDFLNNMDNTLDIDIKTNGLSESINDRINASSLENYDSKISGEASNNVSLINYIQESSNSVLEDDNLVSKNLDELPEQPILENENSNSDETVQLKLGSDTQLEGCKLMDSKNSSTMQSTETTDISMEPLQSIHTDINYSSHDNENDISQLDNMQEKAFEPEEPHDCMDTEPTVTASGQAEESDDNQPSESPQLPTPSTDSAPAAATSPIAPSNSLTTDNTNHGDCSSNDNSNGEGKVTVGHGDVGVTDFNWESIQCVYCDTLVLDQEPKLLPCLHSACHKCVSHEAAQPAMKDEDIVPSKYISRFVES